MRDEDDLGAEAAHHRRALRAVPGRHHRDERVTERAADDGEPRTHVSARHLDDRPSRPQRGALARPLDRRERGAILDAAAGLQVLRLGDDPSAGDLEHDAKDSLK